MVKKIVFDIETTGLNPLYSRITCICAKVIKGNEYKGILLTLKEQFEDESALDKEDIEYLFEIIDLLERKNDLFEKIIREGRHIISD